MSTYRAMHKMMREPVYMKTIFKKIRGSSCGVLIGVVLMCVALLAASTAAGCGSKEDSGGRLKVAVDIVPLADFCNVIGGDLVEVETLVPPGSSPHAYELTSGQMKFLTEADILVTNGLELTPWAEGVFDKVDNPRLVTVVAGEAVPEGELIPAGADGAEDTYEDHEHGSYDPHIWLDPNLAVYIVEAIGDAFAEVDAENAAVYHANTERYVNDLESLDSEIADQVATYGSRGFLSFHSTWTYFARRYGLDQVGVIEELPGKEPSAGEIADLVELTLAMGVRAIFTEPQFSPRAAEAIAEESGGGVVVKMLDPLGDPGNPETDSYLDMMRYDLAEMGEALR
jgi:zinc transport system substrate-binding protein